MSYSVDVNVLLYASDQANHRHDQAIQFLLSRASDPELFCILWSTLTAYIRISTHPNGVRKIYTTDSDFKKFDS